LNDDYDAYVTDLEQKNIENVDHLKQLCQHQKEIVAKKQVNNAQELEDYMITII
jgi:hypothetical protein